MNVLHFVCTINNINKFMHIVTINGVNGFSLSMIPFSKYIKYMYPHVDVVSFNYSSRKETLETIIPRFKKFIDDIPDKIIIVAHSFGGIVAKTIDNIKIIHIITISTPHNGAYMAHFLNKIPPVAKLYLGEIYNDLLELTTTNEITPKITTISSSLLPNIGFDGTVFTKEMICTNVPNHHIDFSYHGLQWIDPRFWKKITEIIHTYL